MNTRPTISRVKFLSTSSARRTTKEVPACIIRYSNFYPRPPRGGRHTLTITCGTTVKFLSTSSARRTTPHLYQLLQPQQQFLSTSSARRTTQLRAKEFGIKSFLSTSSARRTTIRILTVQRSHNDFYPRPPRGGRPVIVMFENTVVNFYPRPPRGGRLKADSSSTVLGYFYPRPPRGGRQQKQRETSLLLSNYITLYTK